MRGRYNGREPHLSQDLFWLVVYQRNGTCASHFYPFNVRSRYIRIVQRVRRREKLAVDCLSSVAIARLRQNANQRLEIDDLRVWINVDGTRDGFGRQEEGAAVS